MIKKAHRKRPTLKGPDKEAHIKVYQLVPQGKDIYKGGICKKKEKIYRSIGIEIYSYEEDTVTTIHRRGKLLRKGGGVRSNERCQEKEKNQIRVQKHYRLVKQNSHSY